MMNNLEKYTQAFINTFYIDEKEAKTAAFKQIDAWDSVGHMGLICCIEETFGVMLDPDDIIDFSSYEKGQKILEKYGVSFK